MANAVEDTHPIDLSHPRDLGGLLGATFGLYGRFPLVFASIAFVVVVPVNLVLLGVLSGWLTGDYNTTSGVDSSIGTLAGGLIAIPLITGMQVRAVEQVGAGKRPSLQTVLASGAAPFGALLLTVILQGIFIGIGLVLLLVPGIFLLVRLYVTPQAVVIEDTRGIEAMRRSWRLTENTWWRVFGITIVILIIARVSSLIVEVPGLLLADSSDASWIVLVSATIGDALSYSFTALAGTLLYFDLRARKAGAAMPGWGHPSGPPPDALYPGEGGYPPPPPGGYPPPPPGGYAPPPPGYRPPAGPEAPPGYAPPAPPEAPPRDEPPDQLWAPPEAPQQPRED